MAAFLIAIAGCAVSNRTTALLRTPSQIPGCYHLRWNPRPVGWHGVPVSDTLRLGPADSSYSTAESLVGAVGSGTGLVRSQEERFQEENWTTWRTMGDTLLVSSPGWNQAIGMWLLAVSDGFKGHWDVSRDLAESERGEVHFVRINCVGAA